MSLSHYVCEDNRAFLRKAAMIVWISLSNMERTERTRKQFNNLCNCHLTGLKGKQPLSPEKVKLCKQQAQGSTQACENSSKGCWDRQESNQAT